MESNPIKKLTLVSFVKQIVDKWLHSVDEFCLSLRNFHHFTESSSGHTQTFEMEPTQRFPTLLCSFTWKFILSTKLSLNSFPFSTLLTKLNLQNWTETLLGSYMGRFTRYLIQSLGALHPRIVCMKFSTFCAVHDYHKYLCLK